MDLFAVYEDTRALTNGVIMSKLKEMSDEELFRMSLKKKKNGCATKEALFAQLEWQMRHNSFADLPSRGELDMDGHSYKGCGEDY